MNSLIALRMPGGPAFVDELKRTWDEGDALLPVDTRLPDEAVTQMLDTMGADVLVDRGRSRTKLDFGRPIEDGDALVIATSGSTGEPKGVVLTHAAISASAEMTSARLDVTQGDHWLACLPMAHIGGLSVIIRALYANTSLTVLPAFDADAVIGAGRMGANLVSLVPTALRRIDPTVFKTILLGGSPPPAERPDNTLITYGSTETGSGVVYERFPLDGVQLKLDGEGYRAPAPANDEGQLLIKSPTLLRCYRDGTDPRTADGWYPSGDAAYFDADGALHVLGRIAEVIITGGEKVWPAPVEQALKTHPAIGEAFVYGEDDAEWGQVVVAHVEIAAGQDAPSLEAVRDHVKQTLPAYCAPRRLIVVDRLARASSGKVERRKVVRT